MLQLIKNDFSKYKTNVPTNKVKLLFKAPLPFLGQKRNWIRYLPLFFQQNLLNNFNPDDYIFLDMFGGSGLLSHNLKLLMPTAEVVYNDYDNYTRFFRKESLNVMKNLHSDLINITGDQIRINGAVQKIPVDKGEKIVKVINDYVDKYNDLINFRQLGSWLLFSAQAFEKIKGFYSNNLYNRIAKQFPDVSNDYLKGLTIEHLDFRELYQKYSTRNKKLFLICDPPYIATSSGNYRNWFSLRDFLELMDICEKETFIMFSSNKSEFNNFVDWHKQKYKNESAFNEVKLFLEQKTHLATSFLNHKYYDQMFYLYR